MTPYEMAEYELARRVREREERERDSIPVGTYRTDDRPVPVLREEQARR